MAAIPNNIILDASVIAKWFLQEENHSEVALEINNDFTKGKVLISIPSIIYYELANLLRSAYRSSRITQKQAQYFYEEFLELDLVEYSSDDLKKEALKKALKFDISTYDAQYVVLAEHLKLPFFTADQKLSQKISSKFLKPLSDYPSSWNERT